MTKACDQLGETPETTWLVHAAERLYAWRERDQGRRLLMTLDERGLHDLSIGRGDSYREYRKHFWQD